MIDRRQLLKSGLGGLTGLLAMPRFAISLQSSAITRLNERLSLITDVGTNILALSTNDGLVLVDSGAPQLSEQSMKHLSELTGSKHIQTVFNTHFHLENTGSNEAL